MTYNDGNKTLGSEGKQVHFDLLFLSYLKLCFIQAYETKQKFLENGWDFLDDFLSNMFYDFHRVAILVYQWVLA